ncbi:unnamed protein product [Camellia sinensis]
MGSCVSVHKNSQSVQSPIKKNTLNTEQIEPQSSFLANVSTFGDLVFYPISWQQAVHRSSFIQTSQPGSSISELSPTDNVKKLADLFSESFYENQVDEYQNLQESKTITSDQKPEGKHTTRINGSPQISEAISNFSNEIAWGRVHKSEKQKLSRKKRLSPNDSIGR